MSASLYDIPLKRIDGSAATLKDYKGKVLLIVNVASECGLTPQYDGLEKLYEKYRAQGLEVLGFPANEFGAQEPGNNAQIHQFCKSRFGVQFPMFEKIIVKGKNIHPLYNALLQAQPEPAEVQWNFEKFLVDRAGKVIARFAPRTTPEDPTVVASIEKALG